MKDEVINCISESRVIVIMRKLSFEYLLPAAEAMIRGGIRLIEVTFDPAEKFTAESTLKQIKTLRQRFGDRLHVGAGTVLTPRQVEMAHEVGAEFIVSPNTDPDVIDMTGKLGLVSIPGAMTPSEIQHAHKCGADYVKVFPAGGLGTEYLRAVLSPLSHIKAIAVGGVDERNMSAFLAAGAVGVGVGSCIVRKDAIYEGEFAEITLQARRMIETI